MSRTEPPVTAAQDDWRVPCGAAPAAHGRSGVFPASPSRPASPSGRCSAPPEPVPEITRHKIEAADIAAEGARLDAAIAQSRKQLTKLRARLASCRRKARPKSRR